MAKATSYSAEWLQIGRPQPMYDQEINRIYRRLFASGENPGENHTLIPDFKKKFVEWLKSDRLNRWSGFDSGFELDVCIGCTHFIDDLYATAGRARLMVMAGDYRYHWRLNPSLAPVTLETLERGKELLIAMPFPELGDVHPQMTAMLDRCAELDIPVHVDAAWLSCVRDMEFDFSHPAIRSFAVSLSKGMGTGGNRIAMRFTRVRSPGPITIMNDFDMNCQSLVHIGTKFIDALGANYFWNKYGESYAQVCRDFSLTPTKAIHLALRGSETIGVRLLLRYLSDR